MSAVVYLDTSAVLRAVLESGLSPDVEARLGAARFLLTSRLSLVESARAFTRLRAEGAAETTLADAMHEANSIWARCAIWELTPTVCNLAAQASPRASLRTLDALHLATFLLARREFGSDVSLLTADARLEAAARTA
jgi:predicted nucleic acid-binding protein